MRSRLAAAVLVIAVLTAAPACGSGGRLATLADEVGRTLGASGDEVLSAAEREAAGSGQSVDDVLTRWRTAAQGAGRVGVSTYEEVPPELRSVVCGTVTDALADAVDGNPGTDPAPLEDLVSATGSLNASVEARDLAADVSSAAADLRAGQPATLALLGLKAGTCELLDS